MGDLKPGSVVEPGASVGDGSVVWPTAVVRTGASIGSNCVVGRGVYVDAEVVVGANCKIQDAAKLYGPARLDDGVFVGPGAILTNDRHPRAIAPDGVPIGRDSWVRQGVSIAEGASVGAGALVVSGVTIGEWAMIGAGAVVANDVAPFSLVVGVPAHRVGWVGEAGARLVEEDGGLLRCPVTGRRYRRESDGLTAVGE